MRRNPDQIIQELLRLRGVTGDEVPEFLSERPTVAHDPFLLHNMEAGVDLILDEIDRGTRICIYGDYDADGVTSVCIMMCFLRHLTDNIFYYIPSRFTDGYGLNKNAIERVKAEGAGLIITVDCGSVSYEEVEYAKRIGLKVIVTDHHAVDKAKSDCLLINPKQKECAYPFKGLAGCGVAFKLCQAIRMRTDLPREYLNDCLDLVAIGTVADIVPLLDENRTMVKYGIIKINQGSRMSIRALLRGISLKHVYSENISFGIAPHINAAGRLGSAEDAVRLFMAESEEAAIVQTDILKERNYMRKSLQDKAYKECMEIISEEDDFIVIFKEDIHEGIGGIVAGKIKEEMNRPCIIMTQVGDGRIKGTGRSIDTIDLHSFLKEFSDLFDSFGGHRGACGFTMKSGNEKELRTGIREKIGSMKEEDPDIFHQMSSWDMELAPEEVSLALYSAVKKMEPFGAGNPLPVFAIKDIIFSDVRYMGDKNQHVKFRAVQAQGDGAGEVECILFGRAGKFADIIDAGQASLLTGSLDTNTWNGKTKVQFRVEEIIK